MIDAEFEGGTRYRMLETLRAFGLDRLAAAGEDEAAAERLLRWAVELTAWIEAALTTEREPEADAVLRRELANLRAAWRLARAPGIARRRRRDASTALFDAVAYRDLVEIRGWAEELAGDSRTRRSPPTRARPRCSAPRPRPPTTAATTRGPSGSPAPGSSGRPTTPASWYCLSPLSVADLARGAYAEVVEHSLAAAALARRPRESLGIAALATAYAGDLDAARALNDRGLAGAVSPTMRLVGRLRRRGDRELAPAAASWPSSTTSAPSTSPARSGATFLVGVATVGLLTVRAAAGRVHEALRGYREVIDYFARTGNWTHLWTTLRNLADLLRRLGDDEPAALLDAAADQAPDAPGRSRPRTAPAPSRDRPVPGRAESSRSPGGPSSGTSVERDGAEGRRAAASGCSAPRRTTPRRPTRCSGLDAQGGDEPGRLGRLRRQRPDLAGRDVRVQHQVDRQPVGRGEDRVAGEVDAQAVVERAPPRASAARDARRAAAGLRAGRRGRTRRWSTPRPPGGPGAR